MLKTDLFHEFLLGALFSSQREGIPKRNKELGIYIGNGK